MFEYLIIIKPLGLMYGSTGAFLSPENLVGRSGAKFPPDAAALSGLFFSMNFKNESVKEKLKERLYTAGPFWAYSKNEQNFYVPIPKSNIIGEDNINEWIINESGNWDVKNKPKDKSRPKMESSVTWQTIQSWIYNFSLPIIKNSNSGNPPWEYVSFLHPEMQENQRCSLPKDGLFLETAVRVPDNISLVYLSTHELPSGWYRFGGENHVVEVKSEKINDETKKLLQESIGNACAFITPAVWGSNRLSHRYPEHPNFPQPKHILTEKPIPYRYRLSGRLGRGRYAVPPGTVYVFDKPLGKSWWEWDEKWFPDEGYSLKKVGCGLCLPVKIENLSLQKGAA
jgi:CRISPR-associated protein Cmr3